MQLEFAYKVIEELPPLAWLAVCQPGAAHVQVWHGRQVETAPAWFCEAVWDAPYAEADFDRTDLVYGSGARCRGEAVRFVSSNAIVDRLHAFEREGRVFVSNSLAFLLSFSNADPDPAFRGYRQLFSSIRHGIERYERQLPVTGGAVRLVYHNNLNWDGYVLREVSKDVPDRAFSRYEDYVNFLRSSLGRISANLSSPLRTRSYQWIGTLSRGYDSPTAVALAKEVGLRMAFSFQEGRPDVLDDGRRLAEVLGVEFQIFERLGWHREGLWEPLFLAADGQGKEVMTASATAYLPNRVLLTGHGGDHDWSMDPKSPGTDLARGGHSGLSLTEFRLHYGFIHFPLPFMGMEQVAAISRISRSPEMARWDVGGSYSRPICRRVLEERGVSHELFGTAKTGASVRFAIGEDSWSPTGRMAFTGWMRTRSASSGLPARTRSALLTATLGAHQLCLAAERLVRRQPRRIVRQVSRRLARLLRRWGLEDLAFLWGMELAERSYPAVDNCHRTRSLR